MTTALRIGCTLPSSGASADPGALGGLAQAAEDLGYDSVWLSDHVVVPERIASVYPYAPDGRFPTPPVLPYLEPLIGLAYLAGQTRRIRLGVGVLILPYRHPLLTAKMIATLDNLSGGRIDLGVGVGWMREEFEALGLDTAMYDRRGAVTDEQLQILDALWSKDLTGFDGAFYRFEPLGAHPHPIQKPRPPIWVGGHSRAALRRTARSADGWLPVGGRPPAELPPDEVAAHIATIRRMMEEFGRDPATLRVCFCPYVGLQDTEPEMPQPFVGTVATIVADLERYRAAGVDSFLVGLGGAPPAEYERRMQRFAQEVRPALALSRA
jgi:probable F420-dependent oxidoreductase